MWRPKIGWNEFLGIVLFIFLIAVSVGVSTAEAESPSEKAGPRGGRRPGGCVETYELKLITGDEVKVIARPDGKRSISINPVGKGGNSYRKIRWENSLYIIPSGVDLRKFDRELFNIDYLIEENYYEMSTIPVLITYSGVAPEGGEARERWAREDVEERLKGISPSAHPYSHVPVVSAKLPLKNMRNNRDALLNLEGCKIWLDRKVEVKLNESVPLVGVPRLWENGYEGENQIIAVLDTGIDDSHPDLDDLDDNERTSDPKVIAENNFTEEENADDLLGHGTHCAGIAAGTGEASGGTYKGVAPKAMLYNGKVLNNDGWGLSSWIISGIEWATLGPDGVDDTADDADVISMSLGGGRTDGTDPVSLACDWAVEHGTVVSVAAGNSGPGHGTVTAPGTAGKVITVGASDKGDELARFSSRGPTLDWRVKPDVAAPGVRIMSAAAEGSQLEDYYSGVDTDNDGTDEYIPLTGTSMAAPHVSGAAALLLEKGVPSGFSGPEYVKSVLISTADDLGPEYGVYGQGGGRIDVADAAGTGVLMSPATSSFSPVSRGENLTAEISIYNFGEGGREIDLSAELSERISQENCSEFATVSPENLSLGPGESAEIDLRVSTENLASGVYGGRVSGTLGPDRSIQSIFGFSITNEVVVEVVGPDGNPAPENFVVVFSDVRYQWLFPHVRDALTDENGVTSFDLLNNVYQLVSFRENRTAIRGDVPITGDTSITLDYRDVEPISFDPNRSGQVMAEQDWNVSFRGDHINASLGQIRRYPENWSVLITPARGRWAFDSSYSYYPEEDYNPDHPGRVNTSEWHKLVYSLENISGAHTFTADYDELVRRRTGYAAALGRDNAERIQFVLDPVRRTASTFGWGMSAPQSRTEWLSPGPARYTGWYWDDNHTWDFRTPDPLSYPEGSENSFSFGRHPMGSGAEIGFWENYLIVHGSIFRDTNWNIFTDWAGDYEAAGRIEVWIENELVTSHNIWHHFRSRTAFSGTPRVKVEIEGLQDSLPLSTKSVTRFGLDLGGVDDRPPRISVIPENSNLYNEVRSPVKLLVKISDESGIDDATLSYSTDEGETWTVVSLEDLGGGLYSADLGSLRGPISLVVSADDSENNSTEYKVMRGIYAIGAVGRWELGMSASGNGMTDNITIGMADNASTLKAPHASPAPSVYWTIENGENSYKEFIIERRDSYAWTTRLAVDPGNDVVFEWENLRTAGVPEDYSLTMEVEGETISLRGQLSYGPARFSEGPHVITITARRAPSYISENVNLSRGWNLFSLPLQPENAMAGDVFSGLGEFPTVYGWTEAGYESVGPGENLEGGEGYWVYSPSPENLTVRGIPVEDLLLELSTGWNLAGMPSGVLPTTPASIFTEVPTIYGWTEAGYESVGPEESFKPAQGYWIYMTEPEDISVP